MYEILGMYKIAGNLNSQVLRFSVDCVLVQLMTCLVLYAF